MFCLNTPKILVIKVRIGPYMRQGKLIEGNVCDILNEQYSSVFSTQIEELIIKDPVQFFEKSCYQFSKERVHVCYEDDPAVEEHWSLLAGEMFIDMDIIKCAILHLPNKLAAGIDAIPAILLNNYANSLSVPDHILW